MEDEPKSEPNDEDANRATPPTRIVGFDETPPAYANDVQIGADGLALHLVFTQFLAPPIFTESDEERVRELGFVPIQVVARVVVAPQTAEHLIRQLQQSLSRHQERSQEVETLLKAAVAEGTDPHEGASED